jgi:hypothetical protein
MVFSLLILFFSSEFWADHQLVSELVSSQLMALGLLKATAGTSSGFVLDKKKISFHLNFGVIISLFLSL